MALTYRPLAFAAALLALMAPVLSAEAERGISCNDFRLALTRAIDDGGDKVARPNLDKRAGGFGPTTRYEMTGIAGLEGQLICWKDQLFNFSATVRLTNDPTNTASHILQFRDLAAAAICALNSLPKPQECESQVDGLARSAKDAYTKARIRGDEPRSGEVGARLDSGARIEVEADEGSLAFFLYPF